MEADVEAVDLKTQFESLNPESLGAAEAKRLSPVRQAKPQPTPIVGWGFLIQK